MTGPEHYKEAERLLVYANEVTHRDGEPRPGHRFADVVAEAHVHATLALAAATVAERGIGPVEMSGWRAFHADDQWKEATA